MLFNLCDCPDPPRAGVFDLYGEAVEGETRWRQFIEVCEFLDLEVTLFYPGEMPFPYQGCISGLFKIPCL